MTWRLPRIKWTLGRGLAASAAAWLLLLAVFAPGRMCEPFLSAKCVSQAWSYVGDAVWLRNLVEWQALVAGMMALAAAAIGAVLLNRQVRLADAQERERWRRSKEAARATLALTLSALTDYIDQCAAGLRQLLNQCSGESLQRQNLTLPDFPPVPMDVAAALQGMVMASEAGEGRPFSAILMKLQVFSSRVRSTRASLADPARRSTLVLRSNLEDYILSAAEIRAMADALFPYARWREDSAPNVSPDLSGILTALLNMHFHDHEHPRLFETAARRYQPTDPQSIEPADTPS